MQTAVITFVSNDVSNFRHHRKHLVDVAVEIGLQPILLAGGVNGIPPANCEYQPIKIERFRFHWTDFRLCYRIFRNLLRERPSILHLVNLKPYLYGGIAARFARAFGWRGKVVVSVPGLGRLYDSDASTFENRFRRRAVELALRMGLSDATICFETKSDRDFWIERGLAEPKKTVVTNGTGIDLSRFCAPKTNTIRAKLRVLYAGRLLKAKGLDVFLDAAKANKSDSVEMVVAGETEADPDAIPETTLRRHPGITYLGQVDDMPGLLAETDVVVLPSRYNEGIPRILIEAAACGCVPVATNFPGSRALIEDGQTGYFLKQDNPTGQVIELSALIEKMACDPDSRHKVGRKASRYIHANGFSENAIKDTFRRIYSQQHGLGIEEKTLQNEANKCYGAPPTRFLHTEQRCHKKRPMKKAAPSLSASQTKR